MGRLRVGRLGRSRVGRSRVGRLVRASRLRAGKLGRLRESRSRAGMLGRSRTGTIGHMEVSAIPALTIRSLLVCRFFLVFSDSKFLSLRISE